MSSSRASRPRAFGSLEPAIVADLSEALARFPRAQSIDLPLYKIAWDPDFFGGEEDREPWADTVK